MTAFEKELEYLNEEKKEKHIDSPEFIQIMQRQTEMFLKLAKILEDDNKQ